MPTQLHSYITYITLITGVPLRPDPEVRKRNKCILELVLGPEPKERGPGKQQWDLANELLDLDTGFGETRHRLLTTAEGCIAAPTGSSKHGHDCGF